MFRLVSITLGLFLIVMSQNVVLGQQPSEVLGVNFTCSDLERV